MSIEEQDKQVARDFDTYRHGYRNGWESGMREALEISLGVNSVNHVPACNCLICQYRKAIQASIDARKE